MGEAILPAQGVGVPPTGSGYSAEPEPSCTVSAVPVSIPNAGDFDDEAACNAEIVGIVRQVTNEVTGGNCTFADADVRLLGRLAARAIRAGLFYDEPRATVLNIERLRGIGRFAASGIEAGTDETAQQAQPEGREPARTPKTEVEGQHP